MSGKRIVLFGPPGSGKGTQAEKLAKFLGVAHISTGEMFRSEIKRQTQLGRRVAKRLAAGELVSEVTALCMVAALFEKNSIRKGFILDGFPRSGFQVEALGKILADHRLSLDHVINLQVSDEEVISRLISRGKKKGRSDDNPASIESRVAFYREMIEPNLTSYETVGLVRQIDGAKSPEKVFTQIKRELR